MRKTTNEISFRWLGVAGIEIIFKNAVLMIDPFLTRYPVVPLILKKLIPDRKLIEKHIKKCNFILVTHSHYDHLLDVPVIMEKTGATAFGSTNTCRILRAYGINDKKIVEIVPGESISAGPFNIKVLPAEHIKTPLDNILGGNISGELKHPLRANMYKLDKMLSFLIKTGKFNILHGQSEVRADILLLSSFYTFDFIKSLISCVKPELLVPLHWDDFFRPLSKTLRPLLSSFSFSIPPLKRIDLLKFSKNLEDSVKTILIPEIFKQYNLSDLV